MASVSIVTNKKKTVLRCVKFPLDVSTRAVDQVATTLDSLIAEEGKFLHIEVDYTDCNDSKTVVNHNP